MQRKSKLNLIILGLFIILASIGLSYAYWKFSLTGDKSNNITSGCFNLEMTDQKDEINLGSTYPITDEEGLKLKPFSFTLKNTCTIFAHYYVNMEMLEGTTLNSKWVAVRVNNEAISTLDTFKETNTSIKNSTESRTIAEGYLSAGDSVDYTVSFWMDEEATIDDDVMNKMFKTKIVVVSEPSSYSPVQAGYDTLYDAILANEYQTTPELAKERIAAKGTPDLSKTAPIIKWIEKTGENTTKDVAKPAASAIKSDEQTSNLTENDTLLKLYKTKTFNEETAYYTLSDPVYVDPTKIDFTDDVHYYFLNEDIKLNATTNKLYTRSSITGRNIYEIKGTTKTTSFTVWNNTEYDTITYKLDMIILNGEELEADKSDKGLYQDIDDYGTTYYYRGSVSNNNVYFANIYWQIIRINGDGSIRLMYNGTEKNATGLKQSINNKTYQFSTKNNNSAYIGYMYGDVNSTNFDEIHTNVNSSDIKNEIDNWYIENIINKRYDSYLSKTTGFCGDRTLYKDDFAAYNRYLNKTAEFTCQNIERDLYTTSDSSVGNSALTYPVGLITYDEIAYSGMSFTYINKLVWTYSISPYYTMTPGIYNNENANAIEWIMNSEGYLTAWNHVTSLFNARPVINLKSAVKITGGIGTTNDPFVVDTNN